MIFGRNNNQHPQGSNSHDHRWHSYNRNNFIHRSSNRNNDYSSRNCYNSNDFSENLSQLDGSNFVHPNGASSFKRRKFSASTWEDGSKHYFPSNSYRSCAQPTYSNPPPPPVRLSAATSTTTGCKRDRSQWEENEVLFMSRDEIERCSPSRKDGIDALWETYLRYSYCAFIQNVGMQLEVPQTTIATAMVLCHRFFIRRSHAFHDRFLIATAALFLTAKSEETPQPLNTMLRTSSEIFYQQDFSVLSYMLPVGWFEQYRERVLDGEQLILTTLNFELNVEHPYGPLTTVLSKLGLSQTVLVNLAINLVSEGVYTRF